MCACDSMYACAFVFLGAHINSAYSVGVVLALQSRFPRADICENTQSGLLLLRTHLSVSFCILYSLYSNLLLMLLGECCSVHNDQSQTLFLLYFVFKD